MNLVTSPGILLRSHPYSESSRILRFLTPDHGLVALVGRGVRKRASRGDGPIETFGEATLVFAHRPGRDLHTLRDYETRASPVGLGRDLRRFTGASLVAELLLAHSLEEGDPELYAWVRTVLARLADVPADAVPGWILAGTWRMLAHLGFSPILSACVTCQGSLSGKGERDGNVDRFDVEAGGLRCAGCVPDRAGPRVGPVARSHLARLVEGRPPDPLPGAEGHLRLLERFSLHHLGGHRRFRSFPILADLLARSRPTGEIDPP